MKNKEKKEEIQASYLFESNSEFWLLDEEAVDSKLAEKSIKKFSLTLCSINEFTMLSCEGSLLST